MYTIKIKYETHEIKKPFSSLCELEDYLFVNGLPGLSLNTVKNIRDKGEISQAFDGGELIVIHYPCVISGKNPTD